MNTRASLAGLTLGLALGAAALALPGLTRAPAQPETPRRADRPPPEGGPGFGRALSDAALSPENLRERLSRRLADARLIETRLEEAIAALDAGTQPPEVIAALLAPGLPRLDRPGDSWRSGPEGRQPLSDAERDRLMAALRQRMPHVAAWADQLESQDPRLLDMIRNRLLPRFREIEETRQRDPAGADARLAEFDASIGVMRATRDYRRAAQNAPPEARAARDVLRASLSTQFDARLSVTRHEIEALGRRIESLRADLAAQEAGRDTLIDAALTRIIEDADRPEPAPGDAPPPGGPPRRPN